jgi:hypothetical protein
MSALVRIGEVAPFLGASLSVRYCCVPISCATQGATWGRVRLDCGSPCGTASNRGRPGKKRGSAPGPVFNSTLHTHAHLRHSSAVCSLLARQTLVCPCLASLTNWGESWTSVLSSTPETSSPSLTVTRRHDGTHRGSGLGGRAQHHRRLSRPVQFLLSPGMQGAPSPFF